MDENFPTTLLVPAFVQYQFIGTVPGYGMMANTIKVLNALGQTYHAIHVGRMSKPEEVRESVEREKADVLLFDCVERAMPQVYLEVLCYLHERQRAFAFYNCSTVFIQVDPDFEPPGKEPLLNKRVRMVIGDDYREQGNVVSIDWNKQQRAWYYKIGLDNGSIHTSRREMFEVLPK